MDWGNLRHDMRYGVKHDSSQNAMRRTAEPKDSFLFATVSGIRRE